MSKEQLARTSYRVGSADVPAILINDRDMHNLDAIWRGWDRPKGRESHIYLKSLQGKRRIETVAQHFHVDEHLLTHFDGEGWWATQLIAVDYARWIDERFGVMVDLLATLAAKRLRNKADALFQEVRQNGKIAHAEASSIRDQFNPIVNKDGKDMKHPIANAVFCAAINDGKKPKDLKAELGLGSKDSLWDHLSTKANAIRLMALAYEPSKLQAVLGRTKDPNEMIRTVEENALKASEAGKHLESS